MAKNAQVLTANWKVSFPLDKEPFNDPDMPVIVTVELLPGAVVRNQKIISGRSRVPLDSTLTLRLNLSNWRRSAKYLRCYRERRYPVACDEAPDVVALVAGKTTWEVEFKLP